MVKSYIDEFLKRARPTRGRLIFALDATASRESTWDTAARLQCRMFEVATGLDVQLVYFRGDEFRALPWTGDTRSLDTTMRGVMCRVGETQFGNVLDHAASEHRKQAVNAVVIISDAFEEEPEEIYLKARILAVPVFLFQEGNDLIAAQAYARIAQLTNGAVACFDKNAAQRLGDLLKAVAAFATGGIKALRDQKTSAAKLLLAQIK